MDFKWPWLVVVAGGLVLVLLVVWSLRPRRAAKGLLVAHSARLRALPRYRALGRQQLGVALVSAVGALLLVVGAILLAARPIRVELTEPDRTARDIELCLDVSRSMDKWNRQIVEGFRKIVTELGGDRMGLTLFSGAAVTVFPLTDDYELIRDRLDEADRAFRKEKFAYFVGAETVERRASQVGDGLVSCLQRFDPDADARGRAVVIATDNDPLGEPVFTLKEAAEQAVRDQVVVYGIAPPDLARSPGRARQFESATESTGGSLSLLQEDTNVDGVVAGIERLDRARLERPPQGTELDDPADAFWLACLGLLLLMLGTLVRLRR